MKYSTVVMPWRLGSVCLEFITTLAASFSPVLSSTVSKDTMVPAAEGDLQPSATGFVGGGLPLGGYGGFGGIGHGVSGLQSGYGSGGYGQGLGGYSNYGNNKALAGGSFGRGKYGKGAVSAFGNQGLGQGGVDQLVAHGLHGVAGATGYNHQGGVNKNFASKGGAKDQFNAGHNKVFAKEKVYAVDQSFQNGNRDAFNLGFGSLGGFTGQGGFGKHDKVNQFGNQKYGAFKGYGQGNYGKQAHNTYGEGVNGYNNYGHLNGYGTQAYQNKGYGNYGRGGLGTYGGSLNRGYGGYGGYGIGQGIGHGIGYGGPLYY